MQVCLIMVRQSRSRSSFHYYSTAVSQSERETSQIQKQCRSQKFTTVEVEIPRQPAEVLGVLTHIGRALQGLQPPSSYPIDAFSDEQNDLASGATPLCGHLNSRIEFHDK